MWVSREGPPALREHVWGRSRLLSGEGCSRVSPPLHLPAPLLQTPSCRLMASHIDVQYGSLAVLRSSSQT